MKITREEEKRQIDRCLRCPYPECINCIGKDIEVREFNGAVYTIAQIVAMTGREPKSIRRRIKIGGMGYALSKCDTLLEYERSKNAGRI